MQPVPTVLGPSRPAATATKGEVDHEARPSASEKEVEKKADDTEIASFGVVFNEAQKTEASKDKVLFAAPDSPGQGNEKAAKVSSETNNNTSVGNPKSDNRLGTEQPPDTQAVATPQLRSNDKTVGLDTDAAAASDFGTNDTSKPMLFEKVSVSESPVPFQTQTIRTGSAKIEAPTNIGTLAQKPEFPKGQTQEKLFEPPARAEPTKTATTKPLPSVFEASLAMKAQERQLSIETAPNPAPLATSSQKPEPDKRGNGSAVPVAAGILKTSDVPNINIQPQVKTQDGSLQIDRPVPIPSRDGDERAERTIASSTPELLKLKSQAAVGPVLAKPVVALDANLASIQQDKPMRLATGEPSEYVNWDARVQQSGTALAPALSAQRAEMPNSVTHQLAVAMHKSPDKPVEIALNPPELGRVRMVMNASESGVVVQVLTERSDTLDLMRRNIDDLGRALSDLGYDDISFSFNQGDPNDHERTEESSEHTLLHVDLDDTATTTPSPTITPHLATTPDGIDIRL